MCSCTNQQYCSAKHGCVDCPDGFEGQDCFTDIDECSTSGHTCDLDVSSCNNTYGGYECICNAGYFMHDVSKKCKGIVLICNVFK